jgi:metallo-beta-lactamase family protein
MSLFIVIPNGMKLRQLWKKIDSYSGHGDCKEMISFLECQDKKAIEKTFFVHGEYETQKNYAAKLKKEGYTKY